MFTEIEKPRLLKATHALARKFKDMERYPRDRDLSPARLEFIKSAIRSGEFRGSEWVSCAVKAVDKVYRLNGRHTSTAICDLMETGETVEALMLVREYAADTMEDAAKLYATFDPRQSARNKSNIVQGFAAACPAIAEFHGSHLSLCCAALAYEKWEEQYSSHSVQEQSLRMLEHAEFVVWTNDLMGQYPTTKMGHLRRVAVVAAMARTWFKSKTAATEFWTKLRDDCDDPVKSPPRLLYRWLLTHGLGVSNRGKRENAERREMFVKCLIAWNAWRKNEATNLNYHAKANTPAAS